MKRGEASVLTSPLRGFSLKASSCQPRIYRIEPLDKPPAVLNACPDTGQRCVGYTRGRQRGRTQPGRHREKRSGGGAEGVRVALPSVEQVKYHSYLRSDGWKKKRAEARKRAKGRCRVCGSTDNLHTHHKTYKRLGKETQADLVVLCASHHFACHDFINEWRAKGWKRKSAYTLTMKYIARERKKRK